MLSAIGGVAMAQESPDKQMNQKPWIQVEDKVGGEEVWTQKDGGAGGDKVWVQKDRGYVDNTQYVRVVYTPVYAPKYLPAMGEAASSPLLPLGLAGAAAGMVAVGYGIRTRRAQG